MPTTKSGSSLRVPKMRLHKASGQAIVTLAGRDVYLGRWSDREKHERYRRAIAEWMAAGCPRQPLRLVSGQAITIDQLADAYEAELVVKAQSDCVRERVKLSLRPLRSLSGGTPAQPTHRAHAATRRIALAARLEAYKAVLGHQDTRMTEHYTATADAALPRITAEEDG